MTKQNLFEQTQILNLDNIESGTIITATVDGEQLILDKDKLFARLGRRRRSTSTGQKKRPSKRSETKGA